MQIKNETLTLIATGLVALLIGSGFGYIAGLNSGVSKMQQQAVSLGLAHFTTHVYTTTNLVTNVVTNVTERIQARQYSKFNWNK